MGVERDCGGGTPKADGTGSPAAPGTGRGIARLGWGHECQYCSPMRFGFCCSLGEFSQLDCVRRDRKDVRWIPRSPGQDGHLPRDAWPSLRQVRKVGRSHTGSFTGGDSALADVVAVFTRSTSTLLQQRGQRHESASYFRKAAIQATQNAATGTDITAVALKHPIGLTFCAESI